MVTRGPWAGHVLYWYQFASGFEKRVVFPSFRTFVAVVINGFHWNNSALADSVSDSDADADAHADADADTDTDEHVEAGKGPKAEAEAEADADVDADAGAASPFSLD